MSETKNHSFGEVHMITDIPGQRLLLNVREAAATLALSERKLWELTHREGLPAVRIGRSVRYRLTDLEEWVGRQRAAK